MIKMLLLVEHTQTMFGDIQEHTIVSTHIVNTDFIDYPFLTYRERALFLMLTGFSMPQRFSLNSDQHNGK